VAESLRNVFFHVPTPNFLALPSTITYSSERFLENIETVPFVFGSPRVLFETYSRSPNMAMPTGLLRTAYRSSNLRPGSRIENRHCVRVGISDIEEFTVRRDRHAG
jgi:hypothetical protein